MSLQATTGQETLTVGKLWSLAPLLTLGALSEATNGDATQIARAMGRVNRADRTLTPTLTCRRQHEDMVPSVRHRI